PWWRRLEFKFQFVRFPAIPARGGVDSDIVPNDVQNDIAKIGVAVVAVRMPAARTQIHLHVAGTRRVVADSNDRAAKVRSAFGAGEAGMENADGPLVGSHELIAAQALVLPD